MSSRKIKFRAWDKINKRFAGRFDLYNISEFTANEIVHNKNLEYQQYTGRRDKNGKEIYEGDIIRDENGEAFWVTWEPSFAAWQLINCEHQYLYWRRMADDFEIIGNIHDNPEMLREE